jgi:hypothetical protein
MGLPATGKKTTEITEFYYCLNFSCAAAVALPRSVSMHHPFPLGVYFNCFGNESSLTDCRATGTLLCTFNNTARVRCAGEMVTGTQYCRLSAPCKAFIYILIFDIILYSEFSLGKLN